MKKKGNTSKKSFKRLTWFSFNSIHKCFRGSPTKDLTREFVVSKGGKFTKNVSSSGFLITIFHNTAERIPSNLSIRVFKILDLENPAI